MLAKHAFEGEVNFGAEIADGMGGSGRHDLNPLKQLCRAFEFYAAIGQTLAR
jgi:hypothetical protein